MSSFFCRALAAARWQRTARNLGSFNGALWGAASSLGNTISELTLEDDDPSVDDLGDGVTATRLIPDLHIIPGLWKIDGYTATSASLLQRGLEGNQNYFDFPYDWRRDNRVSARRLAGDAKMAEAWRARPATTRPSSCYRPFHGRRRCPLFPGSARAAGAIRAP